MNVSQLEQSQDARDAWLSVTVYLHAPSVDATYRRTSMLGRRIRDCGKAVIPMKLISYILFV